MGREADKKSAALDDVLSEAIQRYRAAHPESLKYHQAASSHMPGGNTRTVIWHEPYPLRITYGEGAMVRDADGHEYVDFLGEYTAGLFGHSHPLIADATRAALAGGMNYGAHNHYEAQFAERLGNRFPILERLRFTNSGTEANLMAISTSRVMSGRSKVMVFRGGYHGGILYFGKKSSPLNAPFPWIVAPYNDAQTAARMLKSDGGDIACVLVEPMLGSGGCIPAAKAFLQTLREATFDSGSVLIFDEVMTSRLGAGGASEFYGIKPDMMTLGKYLGGGHSFGAFGGREEMMSRFDPAGTDPLVHAGTFQNNVMTMCCGITVLDRIFTSETADAHHRQGEDFRLRLNRKFADAGISFQASGLGSLMTLHPTDAELTGIDDLDDVDDRIRLLLFLLLLERGYYIARRGFVALSLALEERHLRGFEDALLEVLDEISPFLRID